MEKNSVLRKVSPGEGSLPAGILEGRRKSRPSPSEPLQLYLLIGTPLGEEPQSSPQNATAPSTVGPHVVALICLGKVVLLLSRGRRRVKKGGGDRHSPAHVFHMVILIFQRDLCSPPSFPLCPVGRSTAAKKKKKKMLSLLSGIPLVVFLFLLAMDSTASPLSPPQLGKQEPQVSVCSRQGAWPQKPARGCFLFLFF